MCEHCQRELEKNYHPQEADARIYQRWEEKGYFHAERDPKKKPYTIVMPPPNITGQLHLGHALDNTLPDILIRWKRMQGYAACWMPGTDHASIATEAKIVEALAKEGIAKNDLTREEFLQRAWAWKEQYGGRIVRQLRSLGFSCDWERERFTMDPILTKAVHRVFKELYDKGLIYRGERMVNWCPYCMTTISDAEVEYEEQDSQLTHMRYPLENGEGYLVVATTRPETMLGDTAVAVHPEDERYRHLIGQNVILPLVNRPIPIVADTYVEREFGTGVVKITPAHDPNDFAVGQRHNLPIIDTFTEDGHLYEQAGKYAGMDLLEARKAMVQDLQALDLIEKIEPYRHAVGTCYRCSHTVEPKLSKQWFVKMESLAQPAIRAVREGETRFVPDRFSKTYFNWMENIRDWCISRQLIWGHQIPAWFCDHCGKITVAEETPSACEHCGHQGLHQETDTLDTWFSSALWPFAGFGWPEKNPDFDYFFPTEVLVTGYDIIFFWVARMIFSSLEQTGKTPFKTVFIHGIVRDSQGRKMSKSLGNGIDPMETIATYGADALRYSLVLGTSPGNDMRYQEEKIEAGRAFINKIWNASRFVLMNFPENFDPQRAKEEKLFPEDRWILSRLQAVIAEVTGNLEKYELGIGLEKIYSFIWEEFCDWYIEMVKPRLHNEEAEGRMEAFYVLHKVLTTALQLLHPYLPFVTEEIYQHLPLHEETIMLTAWPQAEEKWLNPAIEESMAGLMSAIRQIRNLRVRMNVPFSRKASLLLLPQQEEIGEIFRQGLPYLQRLASVSTLELIRSKEEVPEGAVSAVFDGGEIFVPLTDLIDFEAEKKRLQGEKEKLEAECRRLEGKLRNEGFVAKAPAAVVEAERQKLQKAKTMLEAVLESYQKLEG